MGARVLRRFALPFFCVSAALAADVSVAAACPASGGDYRAAVLGTEGLQAYWRLDETTGTQACDSKSSNHGTYGGGVLLGQPGASKDGNYGASFDGTSGRVEVPSSAAIAPSNAVTVESWVYSSSSGSSRKTIADKDGSYLLQLSGGNVFWRAWMATGTSSYSVTATDAVQADEWQHVAGSYDGRVLRVFVNGVEVASRVLPGSPMPLPSAAPLRFGQGPTDEAPAWMLGRIDEMAVYSRALNAEELRAHADAATPQTQVTQAPSSYTNSPTATFAFSSPDAGVSAYQCSLDGSEWTSCSSPKTYSSLDDGEHSFLVRAVGSGGVKDVTPASTDWRVAALGLYPPTTLRGNGAELRWAAAEAGSFSGYEVHRGTSSEFTPTSATRLAAISDQQVTSFRDTTARPGASFTYKLLVSGAAAGSQTVTLPAEGLVVSTLQPLPDSGQTTYITSGAQCANLGAETSAYVGRNSFGATRRSLVAFDLRHIPAEASVQSATLSMSAYAGAAVPLTVRAHRATAAWVEGEGDSGSCSPGATWLEAASGLGWQAQGADYDSAAVGEVTATRGSSGWDNFRRFVRSGGEAHRGSSIVMPAQQR